MDDGTGGGGNEVTKPVERMTIVTAIKGMPHDYCVYELQFI